jgi:DNA uptake protein ComE-like DNA-binding protein
MTLLTTTLVAAMALVGQPDPTVIDLNTATLAELRSFRGIGRMYADKIVQARPFRVRAELVERQIMPTSVYLAIKHHLYASPTPPPAERPAPESVPAGMLDLNLATREQLAGVAGIGQRFVDRIIRGRPYRSEYELVGRRIVPLTAFERIQGMIAVGR